MGSAWRHEEAEELGDAFGSQTGEGQKEPLAQAEERQRIESVDRHRPLEFPGLGLDGDAQMQRQIDGSVAFRLAIVLADGTAELGQVGGLIEPFANVVEGDDISWGTMGRGAISL